MTAITVSFATFVMALLGGMLALRFKDRLHLILVFSAGAVFGIDDVAKLSARNARGLAGVMRWILPLYVNERTLTGKLSR